MRILYALFLFSVLLAISSSPPFAQTETYEDWIKTARIGGMLLEPGATHVQIDARLAAYLDQGVSVIELDSGLGKYLDTSEFATHVAHIDLVAERAHLIGLKVVIYYPSLEVLTPNGAIEAKAYGIKIFSALPQAS